MRDYEAPVRAAAERRPHREEDAVEKRRLASSSYFSHNQVDAFLERSGDRLPVAVDQRSRSDSPIRQSDIARLVCRSRSANLSDVLDIPNVFSAVRPAGLHISANDLCRRTRAALRVRLATPHALPRPRLPSRQRAKECSSRARMCRSGPRTQKRK
jgi:hypothetical protein